MKDEIDLGFFSYLQESGKEDNAKWDALSSDKKEDCYKYLILLKRFNKKPELISPKHKKWMLDNCTLPTDLIPKEIMDKKDLWI